MSTLCEVSKERKEYLRKVRKEKIKEKVCRASLLAAFLIIWEAGGILGYADPFIVSSPSRVLKTFIELFKSGQLFYHTAVTTFEALTGFLLGTAAGILSASLLWRIQFLNKVAEPYLVILNSLPKIALGPVFIVWLGSGTRSIVAIALSVSVIVSILEVLSGFLQTDKNMITLLESFGATKMQVLLKVVLPSNIKNIMSSLKVNMGMSWVGVIVGEFLISKAGLGYLIVYGSQVFRLDLVMTSVVILGLVAGIMYFFIEWTERLLKRKSRRF